MLCLGFCILSLRKYNLLALTYFSYFSSRSEIMYLCAYSNERIEVYRKFPLTTIEYVLEDERSNLIFKEGKMQFKSIGREL